MTDPSSHTQTGRRRSHRVTFGEEANKSSIEEMKSFIYLCQVLQTDYTTTFGIKTTLRMITTYVNKDSNRNVLKY
jgi:hypothetical protein